MLNSILHLLFPQICLHCENNTYSYKRLFCEACALSFSFLNPKERCLFCFSPLENENVASCLECLERPPLFHRLLAAFSYDGPPATLVQELKYKGRPDLAKDAAAFMVARWCALELPFPDLIVPVPQAISRRMIRVYNQSELIAQAMGKMMEKPVYNLLQRKSGDFPQMGQNKEQRKALSFNSFTWKERRVIAEKTILLIDDVMTTRTTLSHCAALLQEGFPSQIWGMTFCSAD